MSFKYGDALYLRSFKCIIMGQRLLSSDGGVLNLECPLSEVDSTCNYYSFLYRIVKLTSPNLNYIVIVGAIFMYGSVFSRMLPNTDQASLDVRCYVSVYWMDGWMDEWMDG